MKSTTHRARFRAILLSLAALLFIGGCAVNPVTGKKELLLVGEDWEAAITPLILVSKSTCEPLVQNWLRTVIASCRMNLM